jgi:hypothetical protein
MGGVVDVRAVKRVLLAHVVLLPLAGWALWRITGLGGARTILMWLLGAVILHDLVLLPAYTGLDRLAQSTLRGAVNYVRVPAAVWLLLGLVYYPIIAGRGEAAFHRVSGLRYEGYLARWILSGAALFSVSGVLYLAAARRAGARRSGRPSPPPTPRSAGGSSDTSAPAPDASRPRTPPRGSGRSA